MNNLKKYCGLIDIWDEYKTGDVPGFTFLISGIRQKVDLITL